MNIVANLPADTSFFRQNPNRFVNDFFLISIVLIEIALLLIRFTDIIRGRSNNQCCRSRWHRCYKIQTRAVVNDCVGIICVITCDFNHSSSFIIYCRTFRGALHRMACASVILVNSAVSGNLRPAPRLGDEICQPLLKLFGAFARRLNVGDANAAVAVRKLPVMAPCLGVGLDCGHNVGGKDKLAGDDLCCRVDNRRVQQSRCRVASAVARCLPANSGCRRGGE